MLLTDVVMPGMSGRETAEVFRQRWPKIKVLYASGYTPDAVIRYGVESETDAILEKPFTPLVLTRKIRQALDRHDSVGKFDAAANCDGNNAGAVEA